MTQKEKTVLVSLIFFLIIGIGVRALRSHYSKVYLSVEDTKNISEQNKKFEALRLEAAKVDLNQAQKQDFEKLPGVGPKLAEAIVQYRNQKGRFTEPQEIMEVNGFGKERYEKLKELFLVDGKPALSAAATDQKSGSEASKPSARTKTKTKQKSTKSSVKKDSEQIININRATVEELASLPHISRKLAEQIISYRKLHGPFREKNELLKVEGMGVPLYKKIESQLTIK